VGSVAVKADRVWCSLPSSGLLREYIEEGLKEKARLAQMGSLLMDTLRDFAGFLSENVDDRFDDGNALRAISLPSARTMTSFTTVDKKRETSQRLSRLDILCGSVPRSL